MVNTLLIFFGAGLGGVLRFWVANGIYWLAGKEFPYGTLVVNISGCFLMGLLFVFVMERFNGLGSPLRAFFLIGLLGGYTTFSSFSIETFNLIENGAWLSAGLNIFFSVTLCIIATWIGVIGARQI